MQKELENLTKEEIDKYLTYDFGELVDAGICPSCFNKLVGGKYFGDETDKVFYEDDEIKCQFVGNPRADGHSMIAPKEHFHDMSECTDKINQKIIRFAKRIMKFTCDIFGCERVYIVSMSDGPMNHFHMQLLPRYAWEKRGKDNFSKPRKDYVFDKEKFKRMKSLVEEYAKEDEKQ